MSLWGPVKTPEYILGPFGNYVWKYTIIRRWFLEKRGVFLNFFSKKPLNLQYNTCTTFFVNVGFMFYRVKLWSLILMTIIKCGIDLEFSQSHEKMLRHFYDFFTKLCIVYQPYFFHHVGFWKTQTNALWSIGLNSANINKIGKWTESDDQIETALEC